MGIRLLSVLCIALLLSGCYDLREPEETGIVSGFGIDLREDGKIILIAQTVIPQPPGAGGAGGGGGVGGQALNFENFYTTGETLFDAVRNLSLRSPNQMFFSHSQIIIVSERLAKKGLKEVLDLLERDPEVRPSSWFLVARADLQDVMQSSEFTRQPPTQILLDIIDRRERNSKYAVLRLKDVIMRLDNPDTEAFTAGVTFYKGVMKGPDQKTKTVLEAQRFNELTMSDTAVFKQDKLVGWFNQTESRGLLWLRGEVQQGLLIAKRHNQKITFEVFGSTAALKPEVQDGQLVVKVKITAKGNLGEVNPGIYEIDDHQITLMEKLLAQAIQAQVLAAVSKAKELDTDVLGLGEAVHRAFPEQWNKGLSKEWPEMFKDIDVKVEPTVRIKGLGQISTSVKSR